MTKQKQPQASLLRHHVNDYQGLLLRRQASAAYGGPC